MGKRHVVQPPRRRPRWGWAVVGGVVLLAAGALWYTSGGAPRLVLDREVVDLGHLPFEAPARVVFTLTNAGDGPLRLADVPQVKALKGC